jgi:hypothetical protein
MFKRNKLFLNLVVPSLIIGFAFVVRFTLNDAQAESNDHTRLIASPVLADSRTEMAFCVDTQSFGANSKAQDLNIDHLKVNILSLFDSIKQNSSWEEQGFSGLNLRIDNDCPGYPYLMKPGAAHPLFTNDHAPIDVLEVPSNYRIHIYLAPSDVITKFFAGTNLRSAPQEMICSEHECYEVTTAIYLTHEELLQQEGIQRHLEQVLAIKPKK